MHNLAAHVNGRAEGFQGDLYNIDRAHHSGAKASRLEQQDPFLTGGSLGVVSVRDGIKQRCGHISQYTKASTEGTADKRYKKNQLLAEGNKLSMGREGMHLLMFDTVSHAGEEYFIPDRFPMGYAL
jgi:hypothetical protein